MSFNENQLVTIINGLGELPTKVSGTLHMSLLEAYKSQFVNEAKQEEVEKAVDDATDEVKEQDDTKKTPAKKKK